LENLVATERINCALLLSGCWEIAHRAGSGGRKLPWDDGGKPIYIATTVAGGTVQPAALLAGIMASAARLGAEIREHTRVARIVMEPRLALEVAGKQIYPEYVVVAVNAWLNALISDVVALRSALTFACVTEPLDPATLEAVGLNTRMPFYTTDSPYLWGRMTSDGRAVFGSGLVFGAPARLEKMEASAGAAGAALTQLRNRIQALHPELRAVQFSGSWGGPIAFAADTVPLLGVHPQNSRVLVSGGYAGHGVALSVRAGQLIAEAITENRPLPDWGSLRR
jgi:glycine/D-amino acid oxidase-like deaminating enzyme